MESTLAALKTKGWQKTSAPSYFLDQGKGSGGFGSTSQPGKEPSGRRSMGLY
ncbi:unnamed protein product [Ectocarpus sp. 12 AP-2014]